MSSATLFRDLKAFFSRLWDASLLLFGVGEPRTMVLKLSTLYVSLISEVQRPDMQCPVQNPSTTLEWPSLRNVVARAISGHRQLKPIRTPESTREQLPPCGLQETDIPGEARGIYSLFNQECETHFAQALGNADVYELATSATLLEIEILYIQRQGTLKKYRSLSTKSSRNLLP